ncbi:hypothetical protein [Oceanobacillus luteolus]
MLDSKRTEGGRVVFTNKELDPMKLIFRGKKYGFRF